MLTFFTFGVDTSSEFDCSQVEPESKRKPNQSSMCSKAKIKDPNTLTQTAVKNCVLRVRTSSLAC